MSDNLGVLTAVWVLKQDHAVKKLLIVIDAYVGTEAPFQTLSGRLSSWRVLQRAGTASLDSWHGRERYVVGAMIAGLETKDEDWTIIHLGLKDLRHMDRKLYEEVHSVGTDLRITEKAQTALIKAGGALVRSEHEALCTFFICQPEH